MAQNNSILYLLSYNNYYNRQVKRHETLDDYKEHFVFEPLVCNFNPADGINTEHTYNITTLQVPPPADYVLVCDANNEIVSRWFIVNSTRMRAGQFVLSLYRDLVADFYQEVISAPTFVERAMVSIGNPFIWNSENLAFNQIKHKEILLKDETKSGWYIGYVSADTAGKTITTPSALGSSYPAPPIDYGTLAGYGPSLARAPQAYAVSTIANLTTSKWAGWRRELTANTAGILISATNIEGKTEDRSYDFDGNRDVSADGNAYVQGLREISGTLLPALKADFTTRISGYNVLDIDVINTLQEMNGNSYFDIGSQKVFVVRFNPTGEVGMDYVKANDNSAVQTIVGDMAINKCEMVKMDLSGSKKPTVWYKTNYTTFSLSLEDITVSQGAQAEVSANVNTLTDAPYKMFAIPAETVSISFTDNITYTSQPAWAKQFAIMSATTFGEALYDLQYLPYCPYRAEFDNGKIVIPTASNEASSTITPLINEGQVVSYMIWCKDSNFSFNIMENIPVPALPVDFKIEHETSFCRLVSPNYNGTFEFKPTSNFGVDYFEVNCSYKPFQPYIHLNPKFSTDGLYGGDFNDARGLVCSGDFSLPIVSNQWINYQIQNSAYKDSFNRQIENMETTFRIQQEQATVAGRVNAITAGISGMTAGAMAGSIAPGPWGIGLGVGLGVAGGLASAQASYWGLQQDLKYAQQLQAEALDYSKDQFGYALQNIRALPYSLGRVSAFTINNKVFPFLEFYTATEPEKQALRNKLTYRGMTIGAIGTIQDYLQGEPVFVQGSVIRLDTLAEDYHLASALAHEIHKGVYI